MLVKRTTLLLSSDSRNVERSEHRVVSYARHYGSLPAERNFGLAQKNIQQWLKNFSDSDFEQVSITKREPKKQLIVRGRQCGLTVCFHSNIHTRCCSN